MITLSLVLSEGSEDAWLVEIRGDGVSMEFDLERGRPGDWNELLKTDLKLESARGRQTPPEGQVDHQSLELFSGGVFRLLHELRKPADSSVDVKVHRSGRWTLLEPLTLTVEARNDLAIASDDATLTD